jgi:hypothetical protein
MSRIVAIGLFLVFLLMLGGSAAVLLTGSQSTHLAPPPSPQTLLAQAERNVGSPPAPPPLPPGAHVETENVTIHHAIPLPQSHAAGPPTAAVKPQIAEQNLAKLKIVGASPQETASWQAQLDEKDSAYQKAIQDEIAKLASQLQASQPSQPSSLSTQIVPLITAIAGLIGAIASLIAVFKASPAKAS